MVLDMFLHLFKSYELSFDVMNAYLCWRDPHGACMSDFICLWYGRCIWFLMFDELWLRMRKVLCGLCGFGLILHKGMCIWMKLDVCFDWSIFWQWVHVVGSWSNCLVLALHEVMRWDYGWVMAWLSLIFGVNCCW